MTQRTRNKIEEGRKWYTPILQTVLSGLVLWLLTVARDTNSQVTTMLIEHKHVMETLRQHDTAIREQGQEIATLKGQQQRQGSGYRRDVVRTDIGE